AQLFGQTGLYFVHGRLLRRQGFLAATAAILVVRIACTRRDQATHDHVLLQATQVVFLAGHGRLGEDAGGFLEGGSRDERLRRQRRLGDTQQQAVIARQHLVFTLEALDFLADTRELNLLALDEGRLAHLGDLDLAQHLANDRLAVLVVELHPPQPVNLLYFVDDVAGQLGFTQQAQDVVRIEGTVGNDFALLHALTLEHVELAPLRNQLLMHLATIFRWNDHTYLALDCLGERHLASLYC